MGPLGGTLLTTIGSVIVAVGASVMGNPSKGAMVRGGSISPLGGGFFQAIIRLGRVLRAQALQHHEGVVVPPICVVSFLSVGICPHNGPYASSFVDN